MKPLRLLAAATLAALSLSAHAVGRLADITIYDRATGQFLPTYWHEGRAYVVGKPGNEYQINVKNRSGEDLLAIMPVDGVNILNGQTASTTQGGGYVLSPWENTSIKGWRKSMEEVAAFYFTSLGDSYAGRTGRPNNVGVIGVALYQRKVAEPPPPPAASIAPEPYRNRAQEGASADSSSGYLSRQDRVEKRALQSPSAPLGTGHGRHETSPTYFVEFERRSPEPVETVAIYYDSYRNLVAQGVIPTYGSVPRTPNPFPAGFVPDPR
jgi:hypothetical protein